MPILRRLRAPVLAVLAVATLAGCSPPDPEGVVLIVVDTLRADRLGTYGYSRPTSAQLDTWAESGRVFERALATSPWTLPTMASLFTGQLPSTHLAGWKERGSYPDGPKGFWRRAPLNEDVTTLAERFAASGVATAAFTSNPFLEPRFGLDRGFAVFDNEGRRSGAIIVEKSLEWLNGLEGPFFLLAHFIEPHLPYKAPREYRGQFDEPDERWEEVKGPGQVRRRLKRLTEERKQMIGRRYDEEIVAVDRFVGELLAELEASGRLERTLVVFTSDHGEELFEHGGYEHGHALFQEVVRVPLIFWGPGIAPGRDATPTSTIDLPPTLLEAMNVDQSGFSPGRSLWPLLRSGEQPPPRTFVVEGTLYGPEQKSLVDWPMKLIVDQQSGESQLFDLAADPGEINDLAAERPQVADAMRRQLERQLELAQRKAGEVAAPTEMTPELERELRALGYIED